MTLEDARQLDREDPLAFARCRFLIPDGLVYLDGNSLGCLPAATAERVGTLIRDEWGKDLIAGWTSHGWIDAPVATAARLGHLLGCSPQELLIADSTSVCLFKLLGAAVRARPGRRVILTQEVNFPTDLYVAEGVAEMLGLELRKVAEDEIAGSIGDDTAVVTLTHIDYRSGSRHDMIAINQAAHSAGALALWDLSQSAGALELDLTGDGCDLAVGCGYKYLNGGPGAPAFVFVAQPLQDEMRSPIQGWMGHAEPFAFEESYRPTSGMSRFLTGTPSILALAALNAGLETFEGIEMAEVETKARRLSQYFIEAVEARCGSEVRLASPRDPDKRGSHVSFAHAEGYAVIQALIERRVIGDFRAPDLMRFGFAPLYNRFEDVWLAADALGEVLASREWDQPRFKERRKVT